MTQLLLNEREKSVNNQSKSLLDSIKRMFWNWKMWIHQFLLQLWEKFSLGFFSTFLTFHMYLNQLLFIVLLLFFNFFKLLSQKWQKMNIYVSKRAHQSYTNQWHLYSIYAFHGNLKTTLFFFIKGEKSHLKFQRIDFSFIL